MWGYTLLIYFYLHRVTRKRSLEKKKRRKKKLNSLFPSRIPYGFANNHVIDTFSTDASAHSHIQEPTAITPHQIYSPPTSRHPALYHFLECPLPFSERKRKRERVSFILEREGNIFGTIVVESWTRTLGTASRVTFGKQVTGRGCRIVAATNIRREFFKNQRFKLPVSLPSFSPLWMYACIRDAW